MMNLRYLGIALFSLVLAACSSVSLDPAANAAAGSGQASAPVADGGAVGTTSSEPSTAAPAAQASSAPADSAQQSLQAAAMAARLVYFDYDSYVIKPEFQKLIEANARYLASDARLRVVIEGHTDERGGREYNLALGQRRAEAVRRALTLLGVADAQVEAVSFGEEKPAVAGSTEAAWSQNRRAEINYR